LSLATRIIIVVILVWVFIRTMSYVAWNWKSNNKLGSIMALIVCLASVVLPVYVVFFRA